MTSFQDQWAPTWEVQNTIPGALACIIENTGRTFKTGRPIVDAVFFDANRMEISRRSGMRLSSKRGNEYVVCRREPERPRDRRGPPTAADVFDAATFTADDVFDD